MMVYLATLLVVMVLIVSQLVDSTKATTIEYNWAWALLDTLAPLVCGGAARAKAARVIVPLSTEMRLLCIWGSCRVLLIYLT